MPENTPEIIDGVIKEIETKASYRYIAEFSWSFGDGMRIEVKGMDIAPFGNRMPTFEEFIKALENLK